MNNSKNIKNNMLRFFIIFFFFISCAISKSSYKVITRTSTSSNITLTLKYTGNDSYYIKPTSPIIKDLLFTFQMHSFSDFTFKITDVNMTRFEIPQRNPFTVDPLINSSFSI